MAPHSSTLAWKIAWAEEPGRLQSVGSLRDTTEWLHFHALEKEMATHSNVLAWRIPGTGKPGGLQSMGSHRVGHDWSNLAAVAAAAWRRKWLPIPVFLPGKFHGQRSLAGYSLWGPKELDMTEWLIHIHTHSHTCLHVHTYSVSDSSCRILSVVPYVVQYISVGYFISTSVYMLIPTS